MSRLLKILLYAVVLFFLFLWLSTIVKSCGSDTGPTPTTTTAGTDDTPEETYEEDDFFEDEDSGDTDTSSDPSDMGADSDDEQIDYTEIDKVVEDKLNDKKPKPATTSNSRPSQSKPSSNNSTNVTSGSSKGKYMVMAGSFLIKKNAEGMQRRLEKLGYNNSDIVVFDLSQYHSVVAARFSTYEAALKVSNELKRRGMDCYVHAQQF